MSHTTVDVFLDGEFTPWVYELQSGTATIALAQSMTIYIRNEKALESLESAVSEARQILVPEGSANAHATAESTR